VHFVFLNLVNLVFKLPCSKFFNHKDHKVFSQGTLRKFNHRWRGWHG